MLTGYKVVTGSLIIDKSNNKNLSGLDNLISIGGNLEIGDYDGGNAALTSLTGLQNITSVGGYLNISTNAALTSLTGLENLASIGGYLNIEYNDNLISLTGLENITSVDGDLVIFYNKDLKSLSGLENIASVGGDLWIWNNQALTALGMADLQRVDLDLQISGNTKLCTSMAEQLRDQVQSRSGIGGQIYIGDNKTCTTP